MRLKKTRLTKFLNSKKVIEKIKNHIVRGTIIGTYHDVYWCEARTTTAVTETKLKTFGTAETLYSIWESGWRKRYINKGTAWKTWASMGPPVIGFIEQSDDETLVRSTKRKRKWSAKAVFEWKPSRWKTIDPERGPGSMEVLRSRVQWA